MSPAPVPPELENWALGQISPGSGVPGACLVALTGDASNRRYYRLKTAGVSYIVAEAPPATEKNEAFVDIRQKLEIAGIRVPHLFAVDLVKGYLLLEDLGDRVLLPLLGEDNVDAYYGSATQVLLRMAAATPGEPSLPVYDEALLTEELERFPEWFVEQLMGCRLAPPDRSVLEGLWALLIKNALDQPRVLVHRDFHSRNLMVHGSGDLAVIDFQDAVIGPVTYDLVSLLKDCYIHWPAHRVRGWALSYRDALQAAGHIETIEDDTFIRWFDWMGLQRHIKVLGTFARLYLRDGKAAYLQDLPLVVRYVREVAAEYAPREPAFAAFSQWLDATLVPLIEAQAWSAPG